MQSLKSDDVGAKLKASSWIITPKFNSKIFTIFLFMLKDERKKEFHFLVLTNSWKNIAYFISDYLLSWIPLWYVLINL